MDPIRTPVFTESTDIEICEIHRRLGNAGERFNAHNVAVRYATPLFGYSLVLHSAYDPRFLYIDTDTAIIILKNFKHMTSSADKVPGASR